MSTSPPQTSLVRPPAANSNLSALPPDLAILIAALTVFQCADLLHRAYIGPLSPSYRRLPFRDRFDWDRRVLNLTFQLLQAPFNLYLLLADARLRADCIYGYSGAAHVGFILIIAFYVHDSAGIVMHPAPPSNSPMWLFHHLLAVALLLYDVSYRRSSAFPAAAFLISAAAHVSNEMRWLCTASNVRDQRVLKTCHVLCVLVPFLTCALPPPFLLLRCARQLRVSIPELLTTRMRPQCNFVFALIYIPHIGLIFYQLWRAYSLWGLPPKPFRPTKVD